MKFDFDHTWLTSDCHLGHAKICEYCSRPYKSVADMDEDLPGMSEAHGEEIWYCKGSTRGKLYAGIMAESIDQIFPDEPFRGIKETPHLYVLKHTHLIIKKQC